MKGLRIEKRLLHRVELAVAGERGEVDAELLQRLEGLLGILAGDPRTALRLLECIHEQVQLLRPSFAPGKALPRVLAQLPTDMPLVVDHMAKPSEATARDATVRSLVQRAQHVPTYIKLSGAYRLGDVDAASLAHIWLHEMGAHALLWGSDWPCTNHEALAHYATLFTALQAWVGLAHLDSVLNDNPVQLYGF